MTGPGRRRIVLAAVLALTTTLCLRPSLPGPSIVEAAVTVPAGFSDSTFVSGLGSPTAMAFAPDGRIFVAQQSGELRVVKNGALLATPFVSLTVDSSGERGLLGVAFDPDFSNNHYVYVYYTATTPATHNRVSRFTANGDVALGGSETVLLDLDNLTSATNHNGGAIHFGPDGKLYVGVGENANGANAQSLANLLGKVLRINKDGSIPSDNPFFGSATGQNRAIWAMGLRNPFTFAFQPGGGRMFINDVGQSAWEEIDDGIAGSNYGWPVTEGATSNPAYRAPLFAYGHGSTTTTGCAIAGGAFYNPAFQLFPASYAGKYFFADLCSGWIRVFNPSSGTASDFASGVSQPVDLMVGADGALYYLARGSGSIGRIAYVPTYGVRWDSSSAPSSIAAGALVSFPVSFTNVGSLTWPASGANPVHLSYHWLTGGCPGGGFSVWDGLRTALPVSVSTNGSITDLGISVRGPNTPGAYCLQLDLVREGITWFGTQGAQTLKLDVSITTRPLSAVWGPQTTPPIMSAGLLNVANLDITNNGSNTWNAVGANPVRVSYHWRNGSCPGTLAAIWDGRRTPLPGDVASGGSVSALAVQVLAPTAPGSYCLVYDMVKEGVTWFSTQGAPTLSLSITVRPKYAVSWLGSGVPSAMTHAAVSNFQVSFQNTGAFTWPGGTANPVRFAYHWKNGACPGTTTAVFDGKRTALPGDIAPDGMVSNLPVQVIAPASAGTYCLAMDLVQEGITWFSSRGAATLAATVTVN